MILNCQQAVSLVPEYENGCVKIDWTQLSLCGGFQSYKYIFRTFPSSIFYMLSLEIMPMREAQAFPSLSVLMGMRAHLFPKLMQHIHIALIIILCMYSLLLLWCFLLDVALQLIIIDYHQFRIRWFLSYDNGFWITTPFKENMYTK